MVPVGEADFTEIVSSMAAAVTQALSISSHGCAQPEKAKVPMLYNTSVCKLKDWYVGTYARYLDTP